MGERKRNYLSGVLILQSHQLNSANNLSDFLNSHGLWCDVEVNHHENGDEYLTLVYGDYEHLSPGRNTLMMSSDPRYDVRYKDIVSMRDEGMTHAQIIAKIGWAKATYYRAWKNRAGLNPESRFAEALGWVGAAEAESKSQN